MPPITPPTITIPTTGTNPKTASRSGLEGAVNGAFSLLASRTDTALAGVASDAALALSSQSDLIRADTIPDVVLTSGSGAPNALTGTTPGGIVGTNQLLALTPVVGNTGPVTVQLNGGPVLPLRDRADLDLAAARLVGGRTVLIEQRGTRYRLVTDGTDRSDLAPLETATRYRGTLDSGSLDVNLDPGTYIVTAALAGAPSGISTPATLIVTLAGSYTTQTYHSVNDSRNRMTRVVRPSQGNYGNPWVRENEVVVTDLGAFYRYRSALAGVDLNTVTQDGLYTVTAACPNAPEGAMVGALLRVEANGLTYATQTYWSLLDPTDGWSRVIRPSTGATFPWYRLTSRPLAGKSVVFLGDSNTERFDYVARVAAKTGAVATQGGIGGTRMAVHNGTDPAAPGGTLTTGQLYDPFSAYRIAAAIQSGNWTPITNAAQALYDEVPDDDNRPQAAALAALNWSNVAVLLIDFGTNDFSGSIPIGSPTDTTSSTFKGAINDTLNRITASRPNVQVMLVTPIWRSRNGGSEANVNSLGLKLMDYVDAILERAAYWRTEVLDLHRLSGIGPSNGATLTPDGVHLSNPAGIERKASRVAAGLIARFA